MDSPADTPASNASNDSANDSDSPLSIKRLTSAFAAMLGRKKPADEAAGENAPPRETPTNARTITEALLFVGQTNSQPLSAESIAGTMRDITPSEVAEAVAELNAEYESQRSALVIVESAAGYKLALREELARVREQFYGKARQATLSPPAMEVLSIVAYRQPVTAAAIDELRGQKSQSLLSGLVRRGLVRFERSEDASSKPQYVTTNRFLQVFRLGSVDEIPRTDEFAAA